MEFVSNNFGTQAFPPADWDCKRWRKGVVAEALHEDEMNHFIVGRFSEAEGPS